MGGSIYYGNVNPVAEFNIWLDPEAANIVFNSEIETYMHPLEVTHKALVDEEIFK